MKSDYTDYQEYHRSKERKEEFIQKWEESGVQSFYHINCYAPEDSILIDFLKENEQTIYDKIISAYDTEIARFKQGAINELREMEKE